MRITGGRAKGISLTVPRGSTVRPATDRMREAVFSSLGERVVGARFIDLFAGTGAYGLEAISRGAAGGVFIERDRHAIQALRRNLAAVGKSLGNPGEVMRIATRDALSWRPTDSERASLVFADPPYGVPDDFLVELGRFLPGIVEVASDPVAIVETPGQRALKVSGWHCFKTLGKGRGQPVCQFWRPD